MQVTTYRIFAYHPRRLLPLAKFFRLFLLAFLFKEKHLIKSIRIRPKVSEFNKVWLSQKKPPENLPVDSKMVCHTGLLQKPFDIFHNFLLNLLLLSSVILFEFFSNRSCVLILDVTPEVSRRLTKCQNIFKLCSGFSNFPHYFSFLQLKFPP